MKQRIIKFQQLIDNPIPHYYNIRHVDIRIIKS